MNFALVLFRVGGILSHIKKTHRGIMFIPIKTKKKHNPVGKIAEKAV